MIRIEKYLKSIENLIERKIKPETIREGINGDYKNDKISYRTYTEAIQLIKNISKETGNKNEVVDLKERDNDAFRIREKHKINILSEESER